MKYDVILRYLYTMINYIVYILILIFTVGRSFNYNTAIKDENTTGESEEKIEYMYGK
jgi:hypothetical protein